MSVGRRCKDNRLSEWKVTCVKCTKQMNLKCAVRCFRHPWNRHPDNTEHFQTLLPPPAPGKIPSWLSPVHALFHPLGNQDSDLYHH